MPGRNITLDMHLDCLDCKSSDVCEDGCICPVCYLPSCLTEDQREESVIQWRRFAPLLAELNSMKSWWDWATEPKKAGKPEHSLEISRQEDDCWYEVHLHPEGYVVTLWRRTYGSRETNTAPEVQQLDELLAPTADEAANFLSPTTR